MRKNIIFAAVLVALAPSAIFAQTANYYDRSYVRMSYVQGDVYVQRGQDLGYQAGEVNLVVIAGDKIGTRAGRLELQLGRQNYLRLDNDTVIEMAALPGADGAPTKVHLLSGSVFVRVHSLDGARNFEIDSPDASFYILSEGLYRLDVRQGRETALLVVEGEAEVSGEQGSIVARSGEGLVAAEGRFVENASAPAVSGDDFNSWNDSREAFYSRPLEQSYLPAEYSEYETELADSGSWSYESDYGYVWVPRVGYSDWRPYAYGHWSWYPIIGWTWISDEPWGWCTSHYGRWGWGSHLGWYWIPQSHWGWGPAWVHWYWDSSYIGWSPLSYWGYPSHLVNGRFYDRYMDYGFPRDSRSLMMVRRDQLQARNLRANFLGRENLNRVGPNNLRNGQPDLRPNLVRNGEIANRARGVLSGTSVRGVVRTFSAGTSRLAPEALRQNVIRRPESSSGLERRNPDTLGNSGTRVIRQGGAATGAPAEVSAPRRVLDPGSARTSSGSTGTARELRQFPSRQSLDRGSSGTVNRPGDATVRTPETLRSRETGTPARTIRENSSRSTESQTIRSNPPVRTGAERSSTSTSGAIRTPSTGSAAAPRTLRSPSAGTADFPSRSSASTSRNSGNTSSSSSRILRTPSGSGSSSSSSIRTPRVASSPSRSSAAARSPQASSGSALRSRQSSGSTGSSTPSRSLSSPSRSASSPSRSLSSPSRSYSSRTPSRSLSSPSRSPQGSSGSALRSRQSSGSTGSSSPSRSVSSPSRSSGSSRSSSGPSRSSGSSSRSSSGSSRSSSSGGRIRK